MPTASEPELKQLAESLEALTGYLRLRSGQDAAVILLNAFVDEEVKVLNQWGRGSQINSTTLIKPIIGLKLVPKAVMALHLVQSCLSELDTATLLQPPPSPIHTGALAGLELATAIYHVFHDVSSLLALVLPLPLDGAMTPVQRAASLLLSQLSEEPVMLLLAQGLQFVDKVLWRMPPQSLWPDQGDTQEGGTIEACKRTSRGGEATRLEWRTASKHISTAPLFGSGLLARSAAVFDAVAQTTCSRPAEDAAARRNASANTVGPMEPARVQALRRLATSLQRSKLLPALCRALLAAPKAPSTEPGARVSDQGMAVNICGALLSLPHGINCMARAVLHNRGLDAAVSAAVVDVLAAPEVQRLLTAAAEQVAELVERDAAEEAAALERSSAAGGAEASTPSGDERAPVGAPEVGIGSEAVAPSGRSPGASLAGGWPLYDSAGAFLARLQPGELGAERQRWEAVLTASNTWEAVLRVRGHTAAATSVLPPVSWSVPLALRLALALVRSPPPRLFVPRGGETPDRAAVRAVTDTFQIVAALADTTSVSLQFGASAGEARALLPVALEAWAWGLRAVVQRLYAHAGTSGGGSLASSMAAGRPARSCKEELSYVLHMRCWHLLGDGSRGWAALGPAEQQEAARRLAGVGLMRTLDSALRAAAAAGDREVLGRTGTRILPLAEQLLAPVSLAQLRLPPPPPTPLPEPPESTTPSSPEAPVAAPPPAPAWDAGRDLGVLITSAKLLLRETAPLQANIVRPADWSPGMTFVADMFILEPLRDILCGAGFGPSGLPALLSALAAEATDGRGATSGTGAGSSATPGPGPFPTADAAIGEVLETMALCARAAFLCCARICATAADGVIEYSEPGADIEQFKTMGDAALKSAAAGLAVLRCAARHLPAEALLAAQPLTLLGGVARVLSIAHSALWELRERGDVSRDKILDAGGPLARSLLSTLAALAADPALEPTVRIWLLPPPDGDAVRAGSPLAGKWWYFWAPDTGARNINVRQVVDAVGYFDNLAGNQLIKLQNAAATAALTASGMLSYGGAASAGRWYPSPLLAAAREVLRQAGLQREDERQAGSEEQQQRLRQRLLGSLLPGQRRLWPPQRLRVCGNPTCSNVEGECEADLKLLKCGGCGVVRYCGAACQRAHWGSGGHKKECAEIKAAAAAAAGAVAQTK